MNSDKYEGMTLRVGLSGCLAQIPRLDLSRSAAASVEVTGLMHKLNE